MKWRGRKQSRKIEDRRSSPVSRRGISGSMLGVIVVGLGIYAVTTGDTKTALIKGNSNVSRTGP